MRGPTPKDPRLRRRRNRASTRATLPPEGTGKPVPPLPSRSRRKWYELTVAWWNDVWSSPMAARFAAADIHGLYLVAELVEKFWRHPSATTAREIRLAAQPYGLNPLDRRRLQWEIATPQEPARKPLAPQPIAAGDDPRKILQMVKR